MDPEVEDAAAARERRVVEPRLVRPVGIVEDEVDREDLAERPREARRGAAVPPPSGDRRSRRASRPSAARAASTTARAVGASSASGFWQKTGMPRSSAASACSACSALGVAITIPSELERQQVVEGVERALDGGVGHAATSATPLASIAWSRRRPIQPTPRKPSRGLVATALTAPSPPP